MPRVTTQPRDGWTKFTRRKLTDSATPHEVRIKGLLTGLGYSYAFQRPIMVMGRRYFMDFLVVSEVIDGRRSKIRVAVEIDGGHHYSASNREADTQRDSDLLRSPKVRAIVRIHNSVADTITADELQSAIRGCYDGQVVFLYPKPH